MSRTLYLRVQAVTNHDLRPNDFGTTLTFAGVPTHIAKYGQWFDGERNDGHTSYDYVEFSITGATFVKSPQEQATFNYEGIRYGYDYYVWRSVTVPDNFQIPPDKALGPLTTMPSDAALLAGWQQVGGDPNHTSASYAADGDGIFIRGVEYARELLGDAVSTAVQYQVEQIVDHYAEVKGLTPLWNGIKNANTVGEAAQNAFAGIFDGFNEVFTSFRVRGGPAPEDAARIFDGTIAGALTDYASALNAIGDSSPVLEAFIQGVDVVARVYPTGNVQTPTTFTVDVQNGGNISPMTVNGVQSAMYVFGGSSGSQITGSAFNDLISGGGGNDRINGGGGQDFISGGRGQDSIVTHGGIARGDGGDDQITILGNARVQGGGGNDTITVSLPNAAAVSWATSGGEPVPVTSLDFTIPAAAPSTDVFASSISGGAGWDVVAFTMPITYWQKSVNHLDPWPDVMFGVEEIRGSAGSDDLRGNETNNVFRGMAGNDHLDGGAGKDRLEGGDGDDWLIGGPGGDELFGQGGIDTIDYSASIGGTGVVVDLRSGSASGGAGNDRIGGTENVWGSNYNDTLDGNDGINQLRGFAGNDVINGYDGSDRLEGMDGNDTLKGGRGNDFLFGGNGNDKLYGGAGTDVLAGGPGNDLYYYTNPGSGQMNLDTITDFQSLPGQNTGDSLVLRAGYSGIVFNNGSTPGRTRCTAAKAMTAFRGASAATTSAARTATISSTQPKARTAWTAVRASTPSLIATPRRASR